jgi:hemoglobin-like flavoprotein
MTLHEIQLVQVEARHCETVGTALLDTLARGLGPAFTDEIRGAWATAYGTLSSVMIEAAEEQQSAAA